MANDQMEVVVITGMLNVLLRGAASGWVFSRAFVGMPSITIQLLLGAAAVLLGLGVRSVWRSERVRK